MYFLAYKNVVKDSTLEVFVVWLYFISLSDTAAGTGEYLQSFYKHWILINLSGGHRNLNLSEFLQTLFLKLLSIKKIFPHSYQVNVSVLKSQVITNAVPTLLKL